ncbi:MAG TPA: SurA N-terminal domain-containing protein [Candidatus Megaira endosymbiont of Hartmannula sinica]|nr:SurA N-terminal domain-containing protein [Candidatus Megaera endosymbiont of Hartmannula sinica]
MKKIFFKLNQNIKLLYVFIMLFSILKVSYNIVANNDIVAFVNKEPITYIDVNDRINIIGNLREVDLSDELIAARVKKQALDEIINEKLLQQHMDYLSLGNITQDQVNNYINLVEKKIDLPVGTIIKNLKKGNINLNNFYSKIKFNISKEKILTSSGRNILDKDFNSFLNKLARESKTTGFFDVDFILFTASKKNIPIFDKVRSFVISYNKKNRCSYSCDALIDYFSRNSKLKQASANIMKGKLSNYSKNIQNSIIDTDISSFSYIFKSNNAVDDYSMVYVCKKSAKNFPEKSKSFVNNFFSNKSANNNFAKIMNQIRQNAYIKIVD